MQLLTVSTMLKEVTEPLFSTWCQRQGYYMKKKIENVLLFTALQCLMTATWLWLWCYAWCFSEELFTFSVNLLSLISVWPLFKFCSGVGSKIDMLFNVQVYPEGTHFIIPWFEKPVIYDVRAWPHLVLVESTSGSRDLQMVNNTCC